MMKKDAFLIFHLNQIGQFTMTVCFELRYILKRFHIFFLGNLFINRYRLLSLSLVLVLCASIDASDYQFFKSFVPISHKSASLCLLLPFITRIGEYKRIVCLFVDGHSQHKAKYYYVSFLFKVKKSPTK